MEERIGYEVAVHGQHWGKLHGGYFADPEVAQPLIAAVTAIFGQSPADILLDLGGGTGFLLSQIKAHGVAAMAEMINLDCSEPQLTLSDAAGITSICTSVDSFRRVDLAPEDRRICFLMRSLLHYVGQDGLLPLLRHLRDQAAAGECFVHQTAVFENAADAACLNALYENMRIAKWYPTAADLQRQLAAAGWRVTETTAAPSLLLNSDDLARRYALNAADIISIRDAMSRQYGAGNELFWLTPDGFEAVLQYRIYTCLAV